MAEQMRPSSNEQAPDPSFNYERSHPDREAGMGRLDNNKNATPADAPDAIKDTVSNKQNPSTQINGQDAGNPQSPATASSKLPPQPDHSMLEEEPLGWDQAPQGKAAPDASRHPRTGGEGRDAECRAKPAG